MESSYDASRSSSFLSLASTSAHASLNVLMKDTSPQQIRHYATTFFQPRGLEEKADHHCKTMKKSIRYRYLTLVKLLSLGSFAQLSFAVDDGFEPPRNPYLADSPWPMSHRNTYNQASSPLPGPEPGDRLDKDFIATLPTSITLAYSNKLDNSDERALWGSSLASIFQLDANRRGIRRARSIIKTLSQNPLSGAYLLVDIDNNLYAPHDLELRKYRAVKRRFGIRPDTIALEDTFTIPTRYARSDDDFIVGISMTYDGHLVVATEKGVICVVDRSMRARSSSCLKLPSERSVGYDEVSNSIAVDETGGIFVVTNTKMHRVQWTGSTVTTDTDQGAWSANYEAGPDEPWPGRLGTGSGSTPSLMGSGGMDKFVVFTDGQQVTNLVLMWRGDIPTDWQPIAPGKDIRIAAEIPITFGADQPDRSISEQSVLVRGYGAMVVNNDYGWEISDVEDGIPDILKPIYNRLKNRFPGIATKIIVGFSNLPSVAPYGVEKVEWDPQTRTLNREWARPDISCPNGIPTMSAASNIAYCVGQRNSRWNIEGLDWTDGTSALDFALGYLDSYNSMYAATEIGENKDIISGTLGGIVRIHLDN